MTSLELKRVPDGWEVHAGRGAGRVARFIGVGSKRRAIRYAQTQGVLKVAS